MICLRERQTRFSSSICWPKLLVARISDYSLSTSVLHLCTLEQVREIDVKVPSGIKSSRFLLPKAAVNGTRNASKHWQEFSCGQARDKYAFPKQNDINPCIYIRFSVNLDLEQHGDDFVVCVFTTNLEVLGDVFKNHFLVKKAEIASLKP